MSPRPRTTTRAGCPINDGYAAFLDALMAETASGYDGQVVIVHGDTHYFKIDKPLHGRHPLMPNLTRVETFGSPNIHWIKVWSIRRRATSSPSCR